MLFVIVTFIYPISDDNIGGGKIRMTVQGNLLSKTLVIGIIILFIGMSVVSSTGNLINSSSICKSNNPLYEPNYPPVPKIDCASYGLWFGKVKSGQNVSGMIKVVNRGDNLSLLNWHVDTTNVPTWGTWEFIPENGTDLPYTDSPFHNFAIIYVKCTITEEKGEYIGQIYVYNTDDTSDWCATISYCIIPRNRATTYSLFQLFLDRFPLLEVFLRAMNLL